MEQQYIEETFYFDHQHPEVQRIVREFQEGALSLQDQVSALYRKIRDGWRYNPYVISVKPEYSRASYIVQKEDGHCIDKAILLIACLRALGVPARLRLAKVQNHIAVEKLEARFGTNVMTPHGMVDVKMDGVWLKANPAFNKELCELSRVPPLDFNGQQDSIFQQFNSEGEAFMEYLEDYGHFDDVPLDFIKQNLAAHYPDLIHSIGADGFFRIRQ